MTTENPPAVFANTNPDALERAYLRRRAFQEVGMAIGADDPAARIPHDELAQAYCLKCRAIRDPAECEVCALEPLCRRAAKNFAERPNHDEDYSPGKPAYRRQISPSTVSLHLAEETCDEERPSTDPR
ncbi:hypothetical protein SAMN05428950_1198 [Sphingomonas sp. OV641]|uniref:hypothetical protein n=1 Tax=Sphingomonas sp. ACRSK TaxID=2918213 RepID=UPI0008D704BF|nr:hypothetical protein [Sphingomonas sp. ACRSK]MCG7349937.1 hypothetical protein [Sphingomonas sp. ACRSK]SEK03925.1 hypothetical protein SAMN05428950_1198 [Sphingomonas sp. OV641]